MIVLLLKFCDCLPFLSKTIFFGRNLFYIFCSSLILVLLDVENKLPVIVSLDLCSVVSNSTKLVKAVAFLSPGSSIVFVCLCVL